MSGDAIAVAVIVLVVAGFVALVIRMSVKQDERRAGAPRDYTIGQMVRIAVSRERAMVVGLAWAGNRWDYLCRVAAEQRVQHPELPQLARNSVQVRIEHQL